MVSTGELERGRIIEGSNRSEMKIEAGDVFKVYHRSWRVEQIGVIPMFFKNTNHGSARFFTVSEKDNISVNSGYSTLNNTPFIQWNCFMLNTSSKCSLSLVV